VALNLAAPVTLTSAIDGGLKPRIQIVSTGNGAAVVPIQTRVTAYDNTKTVLTLENPLPSGFVPPNNGDAVYAGSYVASLIAAAVLAYIDGVGPSRVSGYADAVHPWEDFIAIWRIAQTAIDTLDVDGKTKLLKNLVAGGVTIAVGSNAPSTNDYQPADMATNPPELAYASHVVCTQ
jgi:hypothetical protein